MVGNNTKSNPRNHRRDKSGELLQSLLDAIAEPMMLLDDNLQLLFVNRTAEKIAGSRATTVSGASCHLLLCGSCTCCSECPILRLSKKKGRHRFERKRGRHPERIERVELFPLSVQRDGVEGTIVRITDLTRSKQMEHHLVHSEKMSALGLLAAGIIFYNQGSGCRYRPRAVR